VRLAADRVAGVPVMAMNRVWGKVVPFKCAYGRVRVRRFAPRKRDGCNRGG
jgi:hypothetical protein